MKKFLLILSSLFLLVGCSLIKETPSKAVETLFKKYQNLDEAVLSDLELSSEATNLTSSEKEKYMKSMKMQYSDLKYEIVSEEVEGDEAIVTVSISVYDFYKVEKEANEKRSEYESEEKFMDYKLDSMLSADERIDYTISINVTKEEDKWKVEDFDRVTLEKIHGTYDYEES